MCDLTITTGQPLFNRGPILISKNTSALFYLHNTPHQDFILIQPDTSVPLDPNQSSSFAFVTNPTTGSIQINKGKYYIKYEVYIPFTLDTVTNIAPANAFAIKVTDINGSNIKYIPNTLTFRRKTSDSNNQYWLLTATTLFDTDKKAIISLVNTTASYTVSGNIPVTNYISWVDGAGNIINSVGNIQLTHIATDIMTPTPSSLGFPDNFVREYSVIIKIHEIK